MKLASFDIFDTTLIRKCGLPQNIFYLLALKLFPDDKVQREGFYSWRKNIESQIRRLEKDEITLKKIYSYSYLLGNNKYSVIEMMDMEIQIETENLIVNPSILETIKAKRREGFTICFISDMYLSSDTLRKVLKKNSCIKEDERIFVSCEYNARKSDGKLYDIVRNEYHPSKWEHYGDNKYSDIKMSKRKGVKSIFVNAYYTEPEDRLIRESLKHSNSEVLSIFAGLQRASRLVHKDTAEVRLASDFVAPFYIPYVFSILEQSRKLGIKRLYFLSRDAYIIKKIADVCINDFKDIELRYLYVSRRSLIYPYLKDITKEKFLNLFSDCTLVGKTVEEILSYLDADTKTLMDNYGIKFSYKTICSKEEENDLLNKILDEKGSLYNDINKKSINRYEVLIKYFFQEGIFDEISFGMVDVGWLGTTRLMINDILEREGHPHTHFFYLDTRKDVIQQKYGTYSVFLGNGILCDFTAFIESYCSACPYPSCKGYKKDDDKNVFMPIFKKGSKGKTNITQIVTVNKQISQWIVEQILSMGFYIEETGKELTLISVYTLMKYPKSLDFKPLLKIDKFDLVAKNSISFVRRLSALELLRMVVLGTSFTAYDRASLRITVGSHFDNILWNLMERISKIKDVLLHR